MPDASKKDFLAGIVVLCTGVALVVLLIDMQIKKDLLRIGNKAHDDLLLAQALLRRWEGEQELRGVSQRSPVRADLDGGLLGPDVAVPAAKVETSDPDPAPPRPGRANPKRTVKRAAPAGDPGVPSSDK